MRALSTNKRGVTEGRTLRSGLKPLNVEVYRGAEARTLLNDQEFVHQWQELDRCCPWATVYQSEPFARVWYETYQTVYEPILILARDHTTLHGLFLLARRHGGRGLVHVGAHHAEYQAWLSLPDRSNEFVAGAAVVLRKLGAGMLRLHFAVPKLPLDELAKLSPWAVRVHVDSHRRGLMAVHADSVSRAALLKKGNRSKLSRLGRQGAVSLVQLKSSAELRGVIDRIADFCDLRQGGINESMPFQSDPLKREFYLALMDEPNLLHATVLLAGSTLVAAHLGPIDKTYVSLGVITHSPFAARQSPGKLLLYLLAERLGEQGHRVFDLTPGDNYKARFASEEDRVPSVTLYFSPWRHFRHRSVRQAARVLNHVGAMAGVDARAAADRLRPRIRRLVRAAKRPDRAGQALLRRASRWVHDEGEFRIYRMTREQALSLEVEGAKMKVNSIADLLQYTPASEGDAPKADFLRESLRRLENGQTVFTHADSGRLLHYGWIIPCTEEAGSEYGHRYAFAEPAAVLWNGYTHPAARGRGLHQASLRARASFIATEQLAPNIISGVRANNGPSRHNNEKLGFEHVGSAWFRRRLGKSERWVTGTFLKSLPTE